MAQALLALLFISSSKKQESGSTLLMLLLGGITIHLAAKFFIFNAINSTAVSFRMHTCVQFAYGPLLYLYALKCRDTNFSPTAKWYLFIPLIVAVTLYGCVFFGMWQLSGQATQILGFYNTVAFVPIVTSHIVYGLLTPKANPLVMKLKTGLVFLAVLEVGLHVSGNINPGWNIYSRSLIYLLLGSIPVFIVWDKTSQNIKAPAEVSDIPVLVTEARKPVIKTEAHEIVFDAIEKALHQKQLYKNEDLSLEMLCATTGLTRHQVSETLNVFAGKSFYQYINEYRIKEVLRRLDAPEKKTRLLTIAYDSGFKTKASFNQYFKKITGNTPSGYLKQKST